MRHIVLYLGCSERIGCFLFYTSRGLYLCQNRKEKRILGLYMETTLLWFCDLKFCRISSNVLFTLLLASPSLFVTLSCSPWHALLPKMQFKDSSGDCNPKHCKESATRGFIMHIFYFYKMESDLLSSHQQVCLHHQCLYIDIYSHTNEDILRLERTSPSTPGVYRSWVTADCAVASRRCENPAEEITCSYI